MKKPNSIGLMIMGIGLLPVAMLMSTPLLQSIVALASIVLSIIAIIKNIREKKRNQL
jgi:hypothetical protein